MTETATEYAKRVWAKQSESVPRGERVQRVAKALAGQGLRLKDCKAVSDGWKPAVDAFTLQTALRAFQEQKGVPVTERVAKVAAMLEKAGLGLKDVTRVSKSYWKMSSRKARQMRFSQ